MTSGKTKGKATSWSFWPRICLTFKNQVLCWRFLKIRAPLFFQKIIKNRLLHLSCKTEEFWGISILMIQNTRISSIKLKVKGKYSSGEPIFWCGRPATVRTNDLLQLLLESLQEQVIHFLFRTWSDWNQTQGRWFQRAKPWALSRPLETAAIAEEMIYQWDGCILSWRIRKK